GTIFAYGQTSSGKTHTMMGDETEAGVILLAIEHVFRHILQVSAEFLLRVSYLEIYNEVIRDLLSPTNVNLKIHEDNKRGIYVKNLVEHVVRSADQVMDLLIIGEKNRHTGETNMNDTSSRSHTIFKMRTDPVLHKGLPNKETAVKVSQLNLVDLAGSERAGHTGAEGMRLKEGGHINKSLLSLANVIGKLSEGGDKHIPYRDSKLTRILQPSLGGNAKMAIVCTITPATIHSDETHSTLRFASRAKFIVNKPRVNESVSDEMRIKQLRRENELLRQQLALVSLCARGLATLLLVLLKR
ncbi:P-loop containing nucleoside triphosphate hydrolase protein, partial [Entophlyctis helioformis]